MFPAEFIERIRTQSAIDADQLVTALAAHAPASIRVNRGKWKNKLTLTDNVHWEKDGFYLDQRPVYTLDPLFHAGVYYPQESSSMFAGEAFRQIASGMSQVKVLDLCAAPGGKSTHLASLLKENDFLVANEVIKARAAVLAENVTKWGTGNVMVTQGDPSSFSSLPGFFDIILVDAPCSGEGMFRDSVAINEWSPSNARLCSDRQRRIVMDVWPSLKEGGCLIYSTCTFNPAENEENVKWFCENTDASSVALNVKSYPEIAVIDYKDTTSYAFYPGRVRGDGFFLSVLRKRDNSDQRKIKIRKGNKAGWVAAPKQIEEIISTGCTNVWLNANRALALACELSEHEIISSAVNVIKSGTLLGEIIRGKLIPSHDLAMSAAMNMNYWGVYDASYDEAFAYLRMDDVLPVGIDPGRLLMCYRGVPLGFINHLGKRANNGYPAAWRVRMEKRGIFEDIL